MVRAFQVFAKTKRLKKILGAGDGEYRSSKNFDVFMSCDFLKEV